MNPYEDSQESKEDFPSLDSLFDDTPSNSANNNSSSNTISTDFEDIKKESESKKITTADIDIQKELEAKFDELFGALDDDE